MAQPNQAQIQGGRVTLNAQQRTQLRQDILVRGNAPRVNNVNFALRVGAVVPVSVHAIAVPAALIAIRPDFRDHFFFVVRDEIVVVDSGHRIVGLVPLDETVGSNEGPPVAGIGAGDFANLSVEEIRLVQQALVAQGFAIEVDGVFGPGTRQALISFQQRHGFAATGRIDSRTLVALNVNIRGSGGQAPGTTTGQGSGNAQSPAANSNMSQPGQSGSQPSATPQAGSNMPGNNNAGAGTGTSTTGQGNASSPGSTNTQPNTGATSGQAGSNNPPSANPSTSAPSTGSSPGSSGSR